VREARLLRGGIIKELLFIENQNSAVFESSA